MANALGNRHDYLEICFEIERTCAELYRSFAEMFFLNRGIHLMWRRIAREEEYHARQIELARESSDCEIGVTPDSWRTAMATLEVVRQIAAMVRASPPTLEDALVLALKCEKSMGILHGAHASRSKEPAGDGTLGALAREDRKHAMMLEAVLITVRRDMADDRAGDWEVVSA